MTIDPSLSTFEKEKKKEENVRSNINITSEETHDTTSKPAVKATTTDESATKKESTPAPAAQA